MNKKQIRVLLLGPLVAAVLFSLLFYAMGGGQGVKDPAANKSSKNDNGFNSALPVARVSGKDSGTDKMSFYDKADKDSARLRENLSRDPYRGREDPAAEKQGKWLDQKGREANAFQGLRSRQDTLADRVLERLEGFRQGLQQKPGRTDSPVTVVPGQSEALNRLRYAMERLRSVDTTSTDRELDKLGGLLDKAIQIRHPPAPAIKPDAEEEKMSYPVLATGAANRLAESGEGVRFYETDDAGDSIETPTPNMFEAVVDGDQVLISEGTLDLRLTAEVVVNSVIVPRNTILHGRVSLAGGRFQVSVASVLVRGSGYPVSLAVYDTDGLLGIRIRESLARDASKESASEVIGTVGVMGSLDASVGAQAANAGIQAARSLLSRKVRLVHLGVKGGYRVFLKNTKMR